MLSAVNALTKSPKIFHIIQRDSFNLNCHHNDHKYGKGPALQL